MSTHAPTKLSLTERYVHAVTRSLPEEQRADVAEELRASIVDRAESLRGADPSLGLEAAEYAALEELGDPDRLAADYAERKLYLLGPEVYPTYLRVLKSILVVALPVVVVALAIVEAVQGGNFGAVIGRAASSIFTVGAQIAFWTTLVFVIIERTSAPAAVQESLGEAWSPEKLPQPADRGSLGELVTNVVFLALLATAIVWQQVRSPLHDAADRIPILDPDLWSFWLPLILVLLVVEMAFEVVKYLAGGWTTALVLANVALGALFAAPTLYLAVTEKLLNPAAVAEIQGGWPEFDSGVAHTVIAVSAVVIWLWDSIDGWRKVSA